ncbi:copper resistance protein B [Siccirubricoccus sp. KC 17139]|uniref:Copper resistance protein B n=1 Tax=Siccirubricoccus soli TaxID=2899147 RepID=A0ABT1D2Q3_9PROT|nr:copper resistance protein B [Siccirubricoccus soli]MCO6416195.1 copper resistance protein B [Siccirubricoccus soli]MCP2682329.1 copper resistance protein B [Siccirubricoccus soli]
MTFEMPKTVAAGLLAAALSSSAAWAQAGGGHGAHAAPAPTAENPSPVQGAGAAATPSAQGDENQARHPPPETYGIDARHPPLYFGAVLFDQNEVRSNGRGSPIYAWEGSGYYGTDYHRLWVNTRGETSRERGGLERAEVQVLYSRLLGYYWDIQAGVRHDFRIDPHEGTPARTYGAFGLQGLAPGYFEVQLQGFVGGDGVFLARAAASYDLFITNRLVLQPEAELNFSTGWDRDALIAPGIYRTEVGLRLRYEITREFAPYIGYSFESFNGGASGLNRRLGQKPSQSTVVAGIRIFF